MEIKDFAQPVPDKEKAGWQVTSTDRLGRRRKLQSPSVHFKQTKMGTEVAYGQQPEGYDGLAIREVNGGGSVTVPYFWLDGELYVGAIRQERKKMGGFSTEVPRGFSLPTETHDETAQREFVEETGVSESLSARIKPLKGKAINPNSAYFVADPRKGEGVKFFGLEVRPEEVQIRRKGRRLDHIKADGEKVFVDDPMRTVYKFTPEIQGQIREQNEKIKPEGIRFFNSKLLIQTADGFTIQAISRIQNSQKPQTK